VSSSTSLGENFGLKNGAKSAIFIIPTSVSGVQESLPMKIVQIPLLRDNYGYLVVCPKTNNAGIVDPSEAEPVLRRVEQEKVALRAILNTHHHRDHTGGNEGLLAAHRLDVYGHKSDQGRIPGLTHGVDEGDEVVIGELRGKVLFIPGHTTGHVAYLFGNSLFCGDTLFTAGCGRLFEGTPEQMHASLKKLMALPDETKVYCGHEYTESNLRFAVTLEPKNHKLVSRFERVQALRARGTSTVPSTIEEEKQTNPFLRWDSTELRKSLKRDFPRLAMEPVPVFAQVRKLKDAF
jgi:hydroxyacylglutathione hydrolase